MGTLTYGHRSVRQESRADTGTSTGLGKLSGRILLEFGHCPKRRGVQPESKLSEALLNMHFFRQSALLVSKKTGGVGGVTRGGSTFTRKLQLLQNARGKKNSVNFHTNSLWNFMRPLNIVLYSSTVREGFKKIIHFFVDKHLTPFIE